jgi:speckle-type POZ protein
MKDMKPGQFVSSPVFHALGNGWVIHCYPQCSSQDKPFGIYTSFLVRLPIEYKTVNPTINLSLPKRDGKTYTLSIRYKQGDGTDLFRYASSALYNLSLEKDVVNDGSFELICSIDNTDIPHNRCSLGVPKSSDLHSHIGKLLESSKTADVTFHVENRSFLCHRLILAARSTVFNAILFGNMAEATQQEIKIADMCPEVFEAMLHFIYTDFVPGCNSEKSLMKFTQDLFVAADRYALEGLKALCEDKLCGRISLDTVTTSLALALQHNSLRLKNACLDIIQEPETLISWMLTDEYVDLVTSFPSIMAEIRGKVGTIPSFKNVKIQ